MEIGKQLDTSGKRKSQQAPIQNEQIAPVETSGSPKSEKLPALKADSQEPIFDRNDYKTGLYWANKAADLTCKGERWLGTEYAAQCAHLFLSICATFKAEQKSPSLGCPSQIKGWEKITLKDIQNVSDFDYDNQRAKQKQITSAATLSNPVSNLDVDKKLDWVEAQCKRLMPIDDTDVQKLQMHRICILGFSKAAFGLDGKSSRLYKSNPPLSPDIETYVADTLKKRLPAYVDPIDAKIEKLNGNNAIAFLDQKAPEAKRKIDELVTAGEWHVSALKIWCERLQDALGVPKSEFMFHCTNFARYKVNLVTGGKADEIEKASKRTDELGAAYVQHLLAQACYESRKNYKIPYITEDQLLSANRNMAIIETKSVKAGADKEAAMKAAKGGIGKYADIISSNSQYSESFKGLCKDAIGWLLLNAQ